MTKLHVQVEIGVAVDVDTWATTYGLTSAEAEVDAPDHLRELLEDAARRGVDLIGAGARVTSAGNVVTYRSA